MKPSSILEFEQAEPIMSWLNKNLTQNDTVLIKGSHGLRMDRITAALEIQS
jgi:UDP-N-acetylmuramyl pentapeptide synthase